MSTVEEIKAAIERLPPDERASLAYWVLARAEAEWDRRIADDIEAGRLDAVTAEVDRDARTGDLREMP
jgi:hypothetical protein